MMNWKTLHDTVYYQDQQKIIIQAPKNCDLICDCITKKTIHNAPMVVVDMNGDFTIQAKLSHEFLSVYDAACLIIYEHEHLWAKACFECAEDGKHTAVSVMTNGSSDDCNGIYIKDSSIWLRLNRQNDVISQQYSLDGIHWNFMRILSLPFSKQVQAGILAQSPLGNGGKFTFENVAIKQTAIQNMRTGN